MKKFYTITLCLFSCIIHASSSPDLKPTRSRSTSQDSIETIASSRSASPSTIVQAPEIRIAPIQPQIIRPQVMRRNDPIYPQLSTCEVLRQTAQTYKDEIKDCYENGCDKCCHAPLARRDLNPHPQVQDCRAKCCFGCMVGFIAVGCFGSFGYTMIYQNIMHS